MRVSLAILAFVASGVAHGQPAGEEIWFSLYSSPRGAPPVEMNRRLRAGPFPDIVACYSVGALSLDALSQTVPERDYMGRCGEGDLLTLRQMAERAISMLPGGAR